MRSSGVVVGPPAAGRSSADALPASVVVSAEYDRAPASEAKISFRLSIRKAGGLAQLAGCGRKLARPAAGRSTTPAALAFFIPETLVGSAFRRRSRKTRVAGAQPSLRAQWQRLLAMGIPTQEYA